MTADNKTIPTTMVVDDYIHSIGHAQQQADIHTLVLMFERITGCPAVMWGTSIVGFGTFHYRYASGREGDVPLVGFSARKQNITIYLLPGFTANPKFQPYLNGLGLYSAKGTCLHIKKLSDVNPEYLEVMVILTVKELPHHPTYNAG